MLESERVFTFLHDACTVGRLAGETRIYPPALGAWVQGQSHVEIAKDERWELRLAIMASIRMLDEATIFSTQTSTVH